MKQISLILAFIFIIFYGCKTKHIQEQETFLELDNIDSTVNPADDFYNFVNGKWMENTEIPKDKGAWGSFYELREKSQESLLSVLEKAQQNSSYAKDSDQQKAIDFYGSGMDTIAIEDLTIKPLEDIFGQILSIKNYMDLQKVIAELHKKLNTPFFAPSVIQDLKNSQVMAGYIFQGGLGLPSSEHYTDTASKLQETRIAYLEHITKMFILLGHEEEEAQSIANGIMDLETRLAQVSWTPVQLRQTEKMYNPFSIDGLTESCPVFDWQVYLNDMGVNLDTIIVGQPDFIQALAGIIKETNLDFIKNYLRWNVINAAAPYLNHDFVEQDFAFYGKVLQGTPTMRPRWRRVLDATNNAVGFALGKLYVDEYFPPEAKEKAIKMIDNIKAVFKTRIENLTWMTDSTKEEALKKLASFKVKIGYPDKWQEYTKLEIGKSYVENFMNANLFEFNRNIAKLGKPVDPTEWGMTPQTVNAYYHPLYNEIVFPAAILQAPFYNYKADDAINYGGIGAVIGHEITHGFDDQGRQFDKSGNLNDWWTEVDGNQFKTKSEILVDQYSQYEPLEGLNINGQLTLGENIADLGGVTMAYYALQKEFEESGHPESIDGYTAEQRFFMSWATVWRTKMRNETLVTRLKTDPHSPGYYRAVVPLSNFGPFYDAFNVTEDSKMWRNTEERAVIW